MVVEPFVVLGDCSAGAAQARGSIESTAVRQVTPRDGRFRDGSPIVDAADREEEEGR